MSGRIASTTSATVPAAPASEAAAKATPGSKKLRDLEFAAREFEQIFVRSMLQNTPMAGKGDVYGGLAVDAMAKSVTAGHGLGLAELIKRSVEKSELALKESKESP